MNDHVVVGVGAMMLVFGAAPPGVPLPHNPRHNQPQGGASTPRIQVHLGGLECRQLQQVRYRHPCVEFEVGEFLRSIPS